MNRNTGNTDGNTAPDDNTAPKTPGKTTEAARIKRALLSPRYRIMGSNKPTSLLDLPKPSNKPNMC